MKVTSAPLLLLLSMAVPATGAESLFYLGTYTKKHLSEGIYAGTLDAETGKLGPITLAARADNPSYLATSLNGEFVYAAMEAATGEVGAFRVEEGGKLATINVVSSGGDGACYVAVGAAHVFVANYGSGDIASLPVGSDGSLGAPDSVVQFSGSGPDPSRQEKPHAHSTFVDGDRLLACDLGTDNVWIFHAPPAAGGKLIASDPPAIRLAPGSGPRHLAWGPDRKFAYVNGEMAMDVTVFSHPGPGKMEVVQTISSLPEGVPVKGSTSAAIKVHPNGKWLYVSNRGHNSLTTFAIGADGRLTWVDNVPSGVQTPRDFTIDPSGRWLIAAGQDDNRIVVFKVDQATGKVKLTDQAADVGSPVCVVFAPEAHR